MNPPLLLYASGTINNIMRSSDLHNINKLYFESTHWQHESEPLPDAPSNSAQNVLLSKLEQHPPDAPLETLVYLGGDYEQVESSVIGDPVRMRVLQTSMTCALQVINWGAVQSAGYQECKTVGDFIALFKGKNTRKPLSVSVTLLEGRVDEHNCDDCSTNIYKQDDGTIVLEITGSLPEPEDEDEY